MVRALSHTSLQIQNKNANARQNRRSIKNDKIKLHTSTEKVENNRHIMTQARYRMFFNT